MTGPEGFQEEIRTGTMSGLLLRPTHPLHRWVATVLAWATCLAVVALPVAALLSIAFRPTFDTGPTQFIAFVAAYYAAVMIWTLQAALVGYAAFWLISIRALDRLLWSAALVLSGRLVPVELLPSWARVIASVSWFRWGFDFPIRVLIGPIGIAEIVGGLAVQVAWILALGVAVQIVWRRGVRRYGAVGG